MQLAPAATWTLPEEGEQAPVRDHLDTGREGAALTCWMIRSVVPVLAMSTVAVTVTVGGCVGILGGDKGGPATLVTTMLTEPPGFGGTVVVEEVGTEPGLGPHVSQFSDTPRLEP